MFVKQNYERATDDLFTTVSSFDNNCYTCNTCAKIIKKQALSMSSCLQYASRVSSLTLAQIFRRLEKVLIGRSIVFKKIKSMPKGDSPKLKDVICPRIFS